MKHLSTYLGNKYLWIVLIIFFVIFKLGQSYFSDSVTAFTDARISNYATELITKSVEDKVLSNITSYDYFVEHYDNNGKVSYAYLNSTKINEIRNLTSEYMVESLKNINEHENFDYLEIPLGYFLGTTIFLANGIKVPINIEVVGNQSVDIDASVITEGINTTIIEIYLQINVSISVVIPFQTSVVETNTKIPLSLQIMNNDVPYYLGNLLD